MTIQRAPSPIFAALWIAWLANVVWALLTPERPGFGLVVLLLFFAIEIPAALIVMPGNARDTLSEIATWAIRQTSKHQRFARGWNAALLAVILCIAWLVRRTFAHYAEDGLLGTLVAGLIVVWLWDHFNDPVTHG